MSPLPPSPPGRRAFRVAFVRGVTPTKWARIWAERRRDLPLELVRTDDEDQAAVLRAGRAEMGFVRLPVDQDGLHVIPLYAEQPVVVVPKDHAIAAVDEVVLADLGDEQVHPAGGDVVGTLALVAAGVGVVVLPQSVARLHARRDLTYRPVTDAEPTRIGLAWLTGQEDDGDIEDFIGIVRGRTARSSRGRAGKAPAAQPDRKRRRR